MNVEQLYFEKLNINTVNNNLTRLSKRGGENDSLVFSPRDCRRGEGNPARPVKAAGTQVVTLNLLL